MSSNTPQKHFSIKKLHYQEGTKEKRFESISKLRKDLREKVINSKRLQIASTGSSLDDKIIDFNVSQCVQHLRVALQQNQKLLLSEFVNSDETAAQLDHVDKQILESTLNLRKFLSIFPSPKIEEALSAGCVEVIHLCLKHRNEKVQFEALWCIANIASGEDNQASQVLEFLPILNSYIQADNVQHQEQSLWALSNLSVEFPERIISSGTLPAVLHLLRNKFDMETVSIEKQSQLYSDSAKLVRTAIWLLCNICKRGIVNEINDLTQKYDCGLILSTIFHIACESGAFKLPIENDCRSIVGECLWCIFYIAQTVSKTLQFFYLNGTLRDVVFLIIEIVNTHSCATSGNHTSQSLPAYSSSTPLSADIAFEELHYTHSSSDEFSTFHVEQEILQRINNSKADMLVPALKIIATLCVFTTSEEYYAIIEEYIFTKAFIELIPRLLCWDHRGVNHEIICLIGNLAIGKEHHVSMLQCALPQILILLNSVGNCDIKRSASSFVVRLITSHNHKLLIPTLNTFPSLVDAMLSNFVVCKWDKETTLVSLDFFEAFLEFFPNGPYLLYKKNAIEKIESAQFLHDLPTERRISNIVEKYFDNALDEEVADKAFKS